MSGTKKELTWSLNCKYSNPATSIYLSYTLKVMQKRLALEHISHGRFISTKTEILRSILFWSLFIITGIIQVTWASFRGSVRFCLRSSLITLVYTVLGLSIAAAAICVFGYYAIIILAAQPRLP